MKFKAEKKDLLGLLAKTQNVVEKRNTMPILVNVLLDVDGNRLKVFATDLEVSLTDEVAVQSSVSGKVAVNAKNLFDIVKELDEGVVQLTKKENNWLEIKQDKSVFNIIGISSDEYPLFPTFSTDSFTSVDAKMFLDMIEKTIYSVSNDETRYHLNGVYFEKSQSGSKAQFRMVATDGHRLSLVDRQVEAKGAVDFSKGIIVPRKGLNEIRKLMESIEGEFEMAIEGAQLIIRHRSTVLMVRLIEGKYPNYQQLIPQNLKQTVKVDRERFSSSLKRVSLLSNQKSKGITLSLSEGRLEISSNNPELGDAKEELEIDYKGGDMKIGFNAKYIMDILNCCDANQVDIQLNDQLSPGLLRPHNDKSYTCVVMPMRI